MPLQLKILLKMSFFTLDFDILLYCLQSSRALVFLVYIILFLFIQQSYTLLLRNSSNVKTGADQEGFYCRGKWEKTLRRTGGQVNKFGCQIRNESFMLNLLGQFNIVLATSVLA